MGRWVAVGLGCLTALGFEVLFESLLSHVVRVDQWHAALYAARFAALVVGGYVTGHLVGRWHALYGALAAVAYIFVTVTFSALREVALARQLGPGALAPIDFVQLALNDVVAMTGASCGGWLAARLNARLG